MVPKINPHGYDSDGIYIQKKVKLERETHFKIVDHGMVMVIEIQNNHFQLEK